MLEVTLFLCLTLLVFILYDFIPNYYARHISSFVKKEISSSVGNKVVALTFDDGPSKRYTGQVLDILKKYRVKATFFIVVRNAYQCPDLIERIIEDGHELAMHSYKHKSAWISLPWETKREFERSCELFKSYQIPMSTFRPPWGTFNAVSLKYALRSGLEVVLWTVEAFDWRKKNTAHNIAEEVVKRIEHRGIIVLHDSGGAKGAPQHTVDALELLIPQLQEKGYEFLTIREGIHHHESDKIV